MISKILALILPLSGISMAYANSSVNQYLLAAQRDVDQRTNGSQGAGEMNVLGSWLEKAQFRFNAIEDTDFNSDKSAQSYEIRVKPKAWSQRGIEKNILKLRLEQENNSYTQLLNGALKKRYLSILDYLEKQHETHYILKLAELAQREIGLHQTQVSSEKFSAQKLLEAEALSRQSSAMAKLNLSRLLTIESKLGITPDGAKRLLLNSGLPWVIKLPEMLENLSTMNETQLAAPEVQDARLKMQLAQAKTELKKTEHQLGLNLLSFEYKDKEYDAVVFQVGVNIPVGTKFSAATSQYDLSSAKSRLKDSLAMVAQSLAEIETEMTWLAEELKLNRMQNQSTRKSLESGYANTQAFLGLSLQKQLVEQNKKTGDIGLKALRLYISYLDISGQLVKPPLRNWIHHGVPELLPKQSY